MGQAGHVLIVGKNDIVREGLRRILVEQNFSVDTTAPERAMQLVDQMVATPQLIIVDSSSSAESLDTCRFLKRLFSESRLVLMGEDHGIEAVAAAFAAGVDGYLIKAIACEPLVGALKLILLGEKVVPSQSVDVLVDPRSHPILADWRSARLDVNLSDREIQILECLIRGDANKLISRRLSITEATVKVHVKAILRKLRVVNRTQAAIWAVNRGIDRPDQTEAMPARPC